MALSIPWGSAVCPAAGGLAVQAAPGHTAWQTETDHEPLAPRPDTGPTCLIPAMREPSTDVVGNLFTSSPPGSFAKTLGCRARAGLPGLWHHVTRAIGCPAGAQPMAARSRAGRQVEARAALASAWPSCSP